MSENEALERVTNLRLTLRHPNHCALGSSNAELGVGANAASRADMIFVTNDSLSELVWFRHKGLSTRCAVVSIGETKSSFFCGVGPGDMVLSPPHSVGKETNHENFAEQRTSIPPPTASKDDANKVVDQSIALRSSYRNMPAFQSGLRRKSGSCESINTWSRINYVQDDAAGLHSTREKDVSNLGNAVAVDEAIESSSPGLEDRMARNVLPDSDDGLIHGGDKLECVAENELLPLANFVPACVVDTRNSLQGEREQFELEVCEISKASPIRGRAVVASETKGKEKALSSDYLSYESVESCNSARQVSARKKRVLRFEEQLIDGSKRLKMQIRETPGSSSSFTRSNGSFTNWISTMIKGLSRSSGNENKAPGMSSTCDNMGGFQSLFQSIYRPNPKVQDERLVLCSNSFKACKEIKVTDNSAEANTNRRVISSPDDLKHNSSNTFLNLSIDSKTGASSKRAIHIVGTSLSDLPSTEKLLHTPVKKDDQFSGLFINHFFPKSPRFVMNSAQHKQIPVETVEFAADVELKGSSLEEPTDSSFQKLRDREVSSVKPVVEAQNMNQTVHFHRFNTSEAMASIFAKRLDALKNILPSDLTDKPTSSAPTCFFCGIVGHDLRYCPQLTQGEADQLVRNLAAYGGKEESPCLCIRCFQLNHWAAACPNALSRNKNKVEDDGHVNVVGTSSTQFWHQKGFVTDSTGLYVNVEMKENTESVRKVSSNLQNINAARSEENASGSLAMYAFTAPKEIFEAVKSLQLSRTDIIKWMNSIFSSSLDGYYLRLRRKVGEGLGGTQYHVACICGPQEGKSAETSKRPIYVIVDGSRCSVESQYISNQDFREDELKAWWSATLRSDMKIPSEDELRSKVEERRRLGL